MSQIKFGILLLESAFGVVRPRCLLTALLALASKPRLVPSLTLKNHAKCTCSRVYGHPGAPYLRHLN